MKHTLWLALFLLVGSVQAAQIETDCPAINQSREKVDKLIVRKNNMKTRSASRQ